MSTATVIKFEDFKTWKFPNGEWGVVAPTGWHPSNEDRLVLAWNWPDPLNPDLMLLLMCIRSLKALYGRDINVYLSYLPYSRQDRSFEWGNIPANDIFTKAIHEVGDVYLYVLQPHVDCDLYGTFNFRPYLRDIIGDESFHCVSPDLNAPDLHQGYTVKFTKARVDGEIQLTCMTTNIDLTLSAKAVIYDDLCDGGATFITCAKKLREIGFTEVWLCIAHGFFTKGVQHLYDNGIDGIITSDSVCRLEPTDKLIIIDALEEMR